MTFSGFVDLVEKMREAQKMNAKDKSPLAYQIRKSTEQAVDHALDRIRASRQIPLFEL